MFTAARNRNVEKLLKGTPKTVAGEQSSVANTSDQQLLRNLGGSINPAGDLCALQRGLCWIYLGQMHLQLWLGTVKKGCLPNA